MLRKDLEGGASLHKRSRLRGEYIRQVGYGVLAVAEWLKKQRRGVEDIYT
jgi:hypothetical protein